MIDLYTWATPNGWKVSATLEALGLDYTVYPIDITQGTQKSPEFLALNPNGRIPAIVDHDNDGFTLFESGAIMLYLAEKAGKLIPKDTNGRSEVIQWLMFQMGGLGPMQGQANVFTRYFPEKIPVVIDRYQNETKRLYSVLNTRLENREFLVGDELTIADIAHWSWVRIHRWAGVEIDEFTHLQQWLGNLEAHPALKKGASIPHATDYNQSSDEAAEEAISATQQLLQR